MEEKHTEENREKYSLTLVTEVKTVKNLNFLYIFVGYFFLEVVQIYCKCLNYQNPCIRLFFYC